MSSALQCFDGPGLTPAIEAITRLMADNLLIEVPSPETDLLTGGLLDSFSMVQLLVHLENHFGVKIPLDQLEIEDLRSVQSIASMVQRRAIPPT